MLVKSIFQKKEKGSINGLMYVVVSVMAVFLFVIGILPCINILETKVKINNTCRSALLKMETQGYLDNEAKASLDISLNEYGVTITSFEDTTVVKAPYGDVIKLHLKLEYEYDYIDLSNIMNPKGGQKNKVYLNYEKTSIAKY